MNQRATRCLCGLFHFTVSTIQSRLAQVVVLEKLAHNFWSCEPVSLPPETAKLEKESCRNLFFKYCKHPLFLRSVTNTSQVCLTYTDYTNSPFSFHYKECYFQKLRGCWVRGLFPASSSFDLLDTDQPAQC